MDSGSPAPLEQRPRLIKPEAVESEENGEVLEADAPPEVLREVTISGNTARDRVAQWIYMRAHEPGITTAEVARRLNIQPGTLNTIISRAKQQGWLKIDDPMLRVEHELLPKIINNLNYFLDTGDRTVTIEAAKGVVFPQYRESKGISENKIQILGLQIQMPEGGTDEPIQRGSIVGIPKSMALEAEIISGSSVPQRTRDRLSLDEPE